MIKINASDARQLVLDAINVGLVPLLKGSPGMGKSAIMHAIADECNLELIDIRLSQMDPVELNGFPMFENGKARYAPMDLFPTEDTPLPEGKDGWLLFFDELTSAPKSVQAAAYKILLDRHVGKYKINPKAKMVAAGNLSTDKAVTQSMSTALQSRMVHLTLGKDHRGWLKWAMSNGIDHRVIAYAEFNESHLYKFDPDHNDDTFACYRTWEFASRLVKQWPTSVDHSKLPLLTGTLSQGVGTDFFHFLELYGKVVKFSEVIKDPINTSLPDENGLKFATVSMLANTCDNSNIADVIKYVDRMDLSFQILFVRMAFGANRSVLRVPEFVQLTTKFQQYL